jgi:hypothetical protein
LRQRARRALHLKERFAGSESTEHFQGTRSCQAAKSVFGWKWLKTMNRFSVIFGDRQRLARHPEDIQVMEPLGDGLDQEAVRAVQR